MRTIKLTLAYDGTAYHGWQYQPGQSTLQETLERALARITGEATRTIASGRTDAGVHALGQVVSFRSQTTLTGEVLQRALNAELPEDMVVIAAEDVAEDFHAIASACRKRYRYVLCDGPLRDVFARHYMWHVRTRLDEAAMQRAATSLVGTHDFASFETSGSQRETSVRTIYDLSVLRQPSPHTHRVHVEVEADGFLYNMVRTIVGTLVEVGRHVRDEQWLAEVLSAVDRRAAGTTAPPEGLFLVCVHYDEVPTSARTSSRID
jgi:tRNA pseudouridine38-40 synthase